MVQKTSLTADKSVARYKNVTGEQIYPKILKRPESLIASMEENFDGLADQMAELAL